MGVPSHNDVDAVARLLRPASVALIGASADPSRTSGRPLAYLQKHGFAGQIFPVNPNAKAIAGLTCYPDVASLPTVPDVGIVLLGAERAHEAVRDLAGRGTPAAIVMASGYAETGDEGARRQHALREAAGAMRLLGPNTIGLVNVTDRVPLCASGALEIDALAAGSIALVSQSGGILGSLLSRGAARGIGFSKLVATGNEVDLDVADFIDHLADDPATTVIALYLEGLRHADKFRAASARCTRAGKPIVVFKVGRSEAGAQAAASHTGALAGEDRIYDALFRQVGAIRAQTFADLLDLPACLATGRRPAGKRVAILTSTGGAGTLLADALGVAGLEVPAPDTAAAQRLQALQKNSPAVLDRNPIDVTLAGLQPELLRGVIRVLLASPTYDAVVVVVGASALAMPDLMAGAIEDCLPGSQKPVLAYVSPHAPEIGALLTRKGVPAFSAPESCAAALRAMATWSSCERRSTQAATARFRGNVQSDFGSIDPAELRSGPLNEAEAKALFASFGIASVREHVVAGATEAGEAALNLGGKVVLKVLSRHIAHKTEVGGVAAGLAPAEVGPRLETMRAQVRATTGTEPEAFLVQEMVSGGVEMILGLQRHSVGMILLVGMGGVTAEVLKDSTLRLVDPRDGLDSLEALSMVQDLKSWPLLEGYRGRPAADIEALVNAIVAFSRMAMHLGAHLLTAEINPLFVLEKGQGVRAADGLVVLA